MKELGLPFDFKTHYVPCRFSMKDGYDAARTLLAREPGLTAIFALSDAIALGAMRAICDLGLHMPNDVSVVGYDGLAAAYFCIPRLTTIRQDVEQLATRGVQTLLQAIHYKNPPIYETIGFELMEFESVRSVEPQ